VRVRRDRVDRYTTLHGWHLVSLACAVVGDSAGFRWCRHAFSLSYRCRVELQKRSYSFASVYSSGSLSQDFIAVLLADTFLWENPR